MATLRKDVPQNDTWNLEAAYPSMEALNNDIAVVKNATMLIGAYKGALSTPEKILECLNTVFSVHRILEKIGVFVENRSNEDTGNDANNKKKADVDELGTAFGAAVAFVDPELAALPEEFLQSLISDPNFRNYDFLLKKLLAEKAHLLSAKEEELLASYSEIFSASCNISGKIRDADMKFPKVPTPSAPDGQTELSNSTFSRLRQNRDREVRREATKRFFGTYHGFRTTFAETLRMHMKQNVISARHRKFSSIYDYFLHSRGLKGQVCDSLFAAAEAHLPLLHRYCEVRRKKMGLETLHWHDLYVPIVQSVKNNFSYDEAVRIISEALAPLGSDYVKTLTLGLTTLRWVDKYPNQGKRSGAYSAGTYDAPPYMLTNYEGLLNDVFTLAHEGGHSMHSYLSKEAQPYSKYRYEIFLAEIASITNEILVAEHMVKGAEPKVKAFIINQQLEDVRTTFFRQVMFAQFEAMLYEMLWEGDNFSADNLETKYYDLNQRFYGPNVAVNPEVKSEWAYIPHFYYNFYVFQYATGIACALHFADQILEARPGAVENYSNLLKAGGSDYPAVLLARAGLDISKPDYLNALMQRFERLLNEFEQIDF